MANVYIDFDDVLCETAAGLSTLLERHFGRHVAYEDIASFDLGVSFELTPPELEELMRLGHEPAALLSLEPVAGAVNGLRVWAGRGCRVTVVTGRPPACHAASREWLKRHNVPFADLVFVDKYGRGHDVHAGATVLSLEELRTMTFDLAVEDAPGMIDYLSRNTRIPVAVLNKPWNAAAPSGGRIRRFPSWNALTTALPGPAEMRALSMASTPAR